MSFKSKLKQAIKDVPVAYTIAFNMKVCENAKTKKEMEEAMQRIQDATDKAGLTPDKKEENTARMMRAKKVANATAGAICVGIIGLILS